MFIVIRDDELTGPCGFCNKVYEHNEPLIAGGGFKNVLVIGADCVSRYVDWTDRKTCVLFGDAAGAILVQVCVRSL